MRSNHFQKEQCCYSGCCFNGLCGRLPCRCCCFASVDVDAFAGHFRGEVLHVGHLHLRLGCHCPIPSTSSDSDLDAGDVRDPFGWQICYSLMGFHIQRGSAVLRCGMASRRESSARTVTATDDSRHVLHPELDLQRPGCAVAVDVVGLT